MSLPSQALAKEILDSVGGSGIPPKYGFEYFTVGLEEYMNVIRDEYLREILTQSSSMKLVVGSYGGGKTHFLYCIRDLAWKESYAVSYVSLSSEETPFYDLRLVYASIAKGLMRPLSYDEVVSGEEEGIGAFLKFWFAKTQKELKDKGLNDVEVGEALSQFAQQSIKDFGSTSFTRAIRSAFLALLDNKESEFEDIVSWLTGEDYDRKVHSKYGIMQRIDKSSAGEMIRSLNRWLRSSAVKLRGLIILFDEAEKVPSLSSKQVDRLTTNLREFIDQSKRTNVGLMSFYAVPNEDFLSRKGRTYVALQQRFATYFAPQSPQGTKIDLEKAVKPDPQQFLFEVGTKLEMLFKIAYSTQLDPDVTAKSLRTLAKVAWDFKYAEIGYRRLFMQVAVASLFRLRDSPTKPIDEPEAKEIVKRFIAGSKT